MSKSYIKVTEEAGAHFFSKQHTLPVVMLNMLRFKEKADYSTCPELAPVAEISGLQAYKRYMKCAAPLLAKSGGELMFSGNADQFLIGPAEEKWNAVLLVKHVNMVKFLSFASDQEYLAIAGHRTAALADSRLLPLVQGSLF
jgi:uncharacterized protein (DUF1330 family)